MVKYVIVNIVNGPMIRVHVQLMENLEIGVVRKTILRRIAAKLCQCWIKVAGQEDQEWQMGSLWKNPFMMCIMKIVKTVIWMTEVEVESLFYN